MKEIIEKQDELITLYREYSILTIRPDSTAIEWKRSSDLKKSIEQLESELASLKSQEQSEREEEKILVDENISDDDIKCVECGVYFKKKEIIIKGDVDTCDECLCPE